VTKPSTKISTGENFYTDKWLSVSEVIVDDDSTTFLTKPLDNVYEGRHTSFSSESVSYMYNDDNFSEIDQSYVSGVTADNVLSNDSEITHDVSRDVTYVSDVSGISHNPYMVTNTATTINDISETQHTVDNIVKHVIDVSDDKGASEILSASTNAVTNDADIPIVTTKLLEPLLSHDTVDSSVTNNPQIFEPDTGVSGVINTFSTQFTMQLTSTNNRPTHKDLASVIVITNTESDILSDYGRPQKPPKTKTIVTATSPISSHQYGFFSRLAPLYISFFCYSLIKSH
jgi:hypothetical protein